MQTTTKKPNPSDRLDVQTALYLVVNVNADNDLDAQTERLGKALDELPIAALLIAAPDNKTYDKDALKSVIKNVQSQNIAALVSNDPKLAKEVGADGVHMHWRAAIAADYEAARALGGGAMMIGAEAGKSRHDAMVLAETNADYVAFGVPATLKDQETARARQIELVAWWAEMFEIPVVAFDIATPEQAASLKTAGADFIAATLPPNSTDEAQFEAWLLAFADLFPATEKTA